MNTYRNRVARRDAGFTLVELLVVIAIIGILASIVVPNVANYIGKGQMTKAVAEIKNADTALVSILADTGKANFNDFFNSAGRDAIRAEMGLAAEADITLGAVLGGYANIQSFYNEIFYEMLRLGKDSDVVRANFKPEIVAKLGTGYMDIGNDPWGENYNFWPGPQRRGLMLHRSYRLLPNADINNDEYDFQPFYWDDNPIDYNDDEDSFNPYDRYRDDMPGQPKADEQKFITALEPYSGLIDIEIHAYGYPAPKDLPVYIWSSGPNLTNDAHILAQFNSPPDDDVFLGGGDDPNNWDNEGGWDNAPQ